MTKRYRELDGLRGIAALAVFASHAVKMKYSQADGVIFLIADRAGVAAVDLFFVLSGFCLILPYLNDRPVEIITFITRRVLRIFPVYLAVILLSLLPRTLLFPAEGIYGMTPWFNSFWTTPLSVSDMISHLLLIGGDFRTDAIAPVIWTLVVEMKASLIFPFSFRIIRKAPCWYLALILALFGVIGTGFEFVRFFSLFLLGGILARYHAPVITVVKKNALVPFMISLAGISLFALQFILTVFDQWPTHYMLGLTGAGIITLALSGNKTSSFLSGSLPSLFGDLSYPLYLVHLPTMLTVSSLVYKVTDSGAIIWVLSLAVSGLLALVLHLFIEKPGIHLGRRFNDIWTVRQSSTC